MQEMTIARGLTRLKTIKAQINNNTDMLRNAAVSSKEKSLLADAKLNIDKNHAEAKACLSSAMQQSFDLMEELVKIRTAISKANFETQITVAGKTMTIADAMIVRKDLMDLRQRMLAMYQSALSQATNKVDRHNQQVLASTATDKDKEILMAQVVSFVDQKDFESMRDFVTTFLAELDGTLNEINAITKITIN